MHLGWFGVLFALAKLSFLKQNLGQKTSLYHTQKNLGFRPTFDRFIAK